MENKLPIEVKYVMNAVSSIEEYYFKVIGFTNQGKKYQQAAENSFTAELYHQLKSSQSTFDFSQLTWHFDLNKERAQSIRPDLVLHLSPESRKDQRIYIEVKTNSHTTVSQYEKDIDKLIFAVSTNNHGKLLGFSYGIWIVGNNSLENIKGLLKNKSKNIGNLNPKLFLIHFTAENYSPDIYCFADII